MPVISVTAALVIILLAPDAAPREGVTIAGTVVSSKGEGLEGVLVTLVPTGAGDAMKTTRTGAGGGYKFERVAITSNYDIMYSHSKYDLAVVSVLSEAKGQSIHKVLYEKGAARPAMAMLDTLQSAEKVMVLVMNRADEGPIRDVIKNQVANAGFTGLFYKGVDLQGAPPSDVRSYIDGRRKALSSRAAKMFEAKGK